MGKDYGLIALIFIVVVVVWFVFSNIPVVKCPECTFYMGN